MGTARVIQWNFLEIRNFQISQAEGNRCPTYNMMQFGTLSIVMNTLCILEMNDLWASELIDHCSVLSERFSYRD